MSISAIAGADTSGIETPLLDYDRVNDVVDYKGRPINRYQSGGWKSAYFIIGVEVAERLAYYGINSNLISYLTGSLGQSTATAAANANVWSGTASLLPLFGAFVADGFLGRYQTIIIASLLYVLGLGFLTLSAMLTSSSSSDCESTLSYGLCSSSKLHAIFFFFSLYLVAFAQGGHKPCVQAFGADQFDTDDAEERKAKSSFFNWWYFGVCIGPMVGILFLNYIQDNLSWALGFGVSCIIMSIAFVTFLLGTTTYRFSVKTDERSAFIRIAQVFVKAIMNWRISCKVTSLEEETQSTLPNQSSQQSKFLNKALLSNNGSKQDGNVCSTSDIEEAKTLLRLVPIWATCLVYAIVFAQSTTLFTKQGVTMDRSLGPIKISPASLHSIISLTIILLLPIYDQFLVPIARSISRQPSGITLLQRIGTGIFVSIFSMAIAALVEIKRLKTALDYGLIDSPGTTIPMSVWWLTPQYVLIGIADVFTMVGLQEFFYDQVPSDLRSLGLALSLSIFGIGSFLSSFLISITEKVTGGEGRDSWFSNNLNRAHLDYFYWLLAGLSAVGFVVYLFFAKSYIYNR